uniref:Uncharacterized protein n=1 Tax=Chromera velia CCMP2878 TaxID=1169474 RepID=A0A0G4H5X1_9ALVE|eukprot:Cvel_24816.t1-p1 / transcript=Cvel_24816.t1 / gene=Cvel_24816 / organism=Chromera_velia_CCMP2878 / gene_product=Zinc finger protein 571, putative / transcript_product=Zinc finger protein 571, putative / location=Cvel_scaffold2734:12154-14176(+) / protein_length=307 / sequence_SO=supercontig / SO=protein_coding / is_pseudo=false
MAGKNMSAKIVGGKASASTDASASIAKNAEEHKFAFTGVSVSYAKSAGGKGFVNMVEGAHSAKSVEGARFACMAVSAPIAKTAVDPKSVNTTVCAVAVETATGVRYVSTTDKGCEDVSQPSEPESPHHSHEYLGCSFPDLKAHLEKDDFHGNPGMSWENYGSLWHVDHIVPIMYRGGDGQRPGAETQISRLHFTNLQPMWCLRAIRKGRTFRSASKRTHEYLGCSFPDLKPHLEKDDFHGNPGMSWENYGSLWHVDHIVPIMFVGADGRKPDMETLVSRLHFSNLWPMWLGENLRKGNRFVGKLTTR